MKLPECMNRYSAAAAVVAGVGTLAYTGHLNPVTDKVMSVASVIIKELLRGLSDPEILRDGPYDYLDY